jgi:hypothetical protein
LESDPDNPEPDDEAAERTDPEVMTIEDLRQ